MTSPHNHRPRPLPPSDASVEVTPHGRTLFGRQRWRLLLVDGPMTQDLGTVTGSSEYAEAVARAHLRQHLLPGEIPGRFVVRGEPTRGPVGPSGQARAGGQS